MTEPRELIDRSLKVLVQHAPHAFLQMAGLSVDPAAVSVSDTAVNLPEFRADRLLVIGDEGDPNHWGWHLEFQIQPDARVLAGWFLKNAAFNARLDFPVILTVVYLTRGDRVTFPSALRVVGGGLENESRFHTLRLWEHAEAIRTGTLPELAPLLALCEEPPTEATLQRERELILGLEAERPVKTDLLAVALMVGLRYFARPLLEAVFQEEIIMLREVEFIRDLFADELAEGRARGEAEGAHRILLRLLRERFGELPDPVVEWVAQADIEACEAMGVRLMHAGSLSELGFPEPGDGRRSPHP